MISIGIKIIVSIMMSIVLMLVPTACGGNNTATTESAQEEAAEISDESSTDSSTESLTEGSSETSDENKEESSEQEVQEEEKMIYAYIREKVLTIEPADNSSAEAFMALLGEGDISVDMHDYGGFEKVGGLGTSLPTNNESITTEPGDVILYQGNQITIYYGVNTWDFTRLGKVKDLTQDELKAALGEGDVTVRFSLNNPEAGESSDISEVGVFDFDNKTVLLNSGYEMPIMGLGTYSLDRNEKHDWY